MNDGGAKFRIAISGVLCTAIIFYSIFNLLSGKISCNSSLPTDASALPQIYNEGYKPEPFAKSDNSAESSPASENSSVAVEASTSSKVVGRVIEKFISPYTANTSYKNIYLKNSTDLKIDIKQLLEEPLNFTIKKGAEPCILILHTHATESFLDTARDYYTDSDKARSTDNSVNMVALGEIVASKLTSAGYGVIHDKTLHDYPSYNESYSRAAKTITEYLKKYPSIKIVIDMHRDAISSSDTDKVKVTSQINGKKAAQIMIVMGSQSGTVKNFPNWRENLKLAIRLQEKLEGMYPTLARSLSLMPRNYNESLSTGSMLIETGTDANSLEEVKYSAELLSNSLCALLDEI